MMAVPTLFLDLVDDAGLFPPERLPMPAAVARHRADAAVGHPVLTHRFLCPASELDSLRAQLERDDKIRLGLIADTGTVGLPARCASVAADARLRLETVEIALPDERVAVAARSLVPVLTAIDALVFVEIPRVPGWRDALDVAAAAGLGAKVRCGGARADLFPAPHELAAFVVGAVARGVRFKATAGLHHAVRYRDPRTGFHHHGFCNLLVAVCRAVQGAPVSDVAAALAVDDAAEVAAQARAVTRSVATSARALFVAYGSCSTREPVDDLEALDLLNGAR